MLAIAGTTFANFQSEKAAKEARVQAAVERAENEAAELAAEAKEFEMKERITLGFLRDIASFP